jgi:hypothetical protein
MEYGARLNAMEDRHREELAVSSSTTTTTTRDSSGQVAVTLGEENVLERQRKLEQIRKKREIERQKEIDRERGLSEEIANAGPSPRDIEMEQILQQLRPLHYDIEPISADGNCLYRAVAAQCSGIASGTNPTVSYQDIRTFFSNRENIPTDPDWLKCS